MQIEILSIYGFFFLIAILIIMASLIYRQKVFTDLYNALVPYAATIKMSQGWYSNIDVVFKPEYELENVSISTFTIHHGKSSTTYFRIIGKSYPGSSYYLELNREHIFSFLSKKLLGTPDVTLGIPQIDDRFIIKANNVDLTKKLMTDRTFLKYIYNMGGFRLFKIFPGDPLTLIAEVNFSSSKAINAIYAMERALAIVASERKVAAIGYEAAPSQQISEQPIKTPPIERTKPIETSQVIQKPPVIQHPATSSIASSSEFRRMFEGIRLYISEIEYVPSPENFEKVIITPWISDLDKVIYEFGALMHVTGIEKLTQPIENDLWIEIKRSGYKLKTRYPTVSEIRNAIDIKSNIKRVREELNYRLGFLQTILEIKNLQKLRAEVTDSEIKITIECESNPENVKSTFNALKELSWIIKTAFL